MGFLSKKTKSNSCGFTEYLRTDLLRETSFADVRLHMEKVKVDDELLLKYLRGRKYDTFIAWDTLRRYSENKFHLYREMFPHDDGFPKNVRELVARHAVGLLKHRDKFGRIIVFADMAKWDPNVHTLEDITMAAVVACERLWHNPEVLNKGAILIQNTKGFGFGHAKHHTMHNLMRMRNIFSYSYPIGLKGIYYFNMASIFRMVFNISKPLFPKKLKSRMFMYSSNQTPKSLFEVASSEILPTWAGGTLKIEEAAENMQFYDKIVCSAED